MILSILVIALVGAIAFFHYIQGFFSATLSAILTVFCAVFAVAYHEVLVDSIGQGQYADQAHAIALVVLFAGPYVLLRVIFDKFIPGNVQMAAIVDKIGAGAMGFVAGCFGVGVLILAAQTLPLRPSIAMHSLYEMNGQRNVVLPGGAGRRNQDAAVFDELKSDTFADEDRSSLILPVDTWLISLASHLSSGSLSGPVQFSDVHPDYQTELFGQRIGIQPGAKHTALGSDEHQWVRVDALFSIDRVKQADSEIPGLRTMSLSPEIDVPNDEILLVVRTLFDRSATDKDNIFRFSPGSVRLVANGKNYFPIGTLHQGAVLLRNRIDDFLFVKVDADPRGADLVFRIPKTDLLGEGTKASQVADGVFLNVKRLARVDLGGKAIQGLDNPSQTLTPSEKVNVLRKDAVAKSPTPQAAAPTAVADPGSLPLTSPRFQVGDFLFTAVNVQTPDENIRNHPFSSGEVSLRDRKFAELEINTTETVGRLRQGEYVVEQFYVPDNLVMVQVVATPNPSAPWNWAEKLGEFELVDSDGNRHLPNGAWARVKQGTQDKIIAKYTSDAMVLSIVPEDGRPTDVWIAFLVPRGTQITELQFEKKTALRESLKLP